MDGTEGEGTLQFLTHILLKWIMLDHLALWSHGWFHFVLISNNIWIFLLVCFLLENVLVLLYTNTVGLASNFSPSFGSSSPSPV